VAAATNKTRFTQVIILHVLHIFFSFLFGAGTILFEDTCNNNVDNTLQFVKGVPLSKSLKRIKFEMLAQ
jgi:hypothetical protein